MNFHKDFINRVGKFLHKNAQPFNYAVMVEFDPLNYITPMGYARKCKMTSICDSPESDEQTWVWIPELKCYANAKYEVEI